MYAALATAVLSCVDKTTLLPFGFFVLIGCYLIVFIHLFTSSHSLDSAIPILQGSMKGSENHTNASGLSLQNDL
uniref:Ovule protein n=1 Tax=Haemonchus contortus TaxID=6289 RepID=A0A7I4Y750_HAECO